MSESNTTTIKKPKGNRLRWWRSLKLREIFQGTKTEPGKRRGTPQRKVRWGRDRQLEAAKANRVRKSRAKRRMTKAIQRNRRRKGRCHRHG